MSLRQLIQMILISIDDKRVYVLLGLSTLIPKDNASSIRHFGAIRQYRIFKKILLNQSSQIFTFVQHNLLRKERYLWEVREVDKGFRFFIPNLSWIFVKYISWDTQRLKSHHLITIIPIIFLTTPIFFIQNSLFNSTLTFSTSNLLFLLLKDH